jgi:proteic killer suppression protein
MPVRIVIALKVWTELVETEGLEEVGKIPGYHDEPLAGKRAGQRSIRLNIAYRAIYQIEVDTSGTGYGHLVSIEEVSKHEY